MPLAGGAHAKPDVVLAFGVTRENAEARYLARARDGNDSREKFERRFAEYVGETVPVEEVYRRRGVLVEVDANGSREENVEEVTRRLGESALWREVVVERRRGARFLV